jgi:hypothetical protein
VCCWFWFGLARLPEKLVAKLSADLEQDLAENLVEELAGNLFDNNCVTGNNRKVSSEDISFGGFRYMLRSH